MYKYICSYEAILIMKLCYVAKWLCTYLIIEQMYYYCTASTETTSAVPGAIDTFPTSSSGSENQTELLNRSEKQNLLQSI